MAAVPVKISRALAAVLLRDLPEHIANAERAGIAPPNLALNYGDGLTRADALALWQWGQKLPAVRAALRDRQHPEHGAVNAYQALSNYFLQDHPQQTNGEPAAWSEPISPALAGMILGTRNRIEASELLPSEAAALAQYGRTRGDAGSETIRAELESLYARAAEPDPGPAGEANDSANAPATEAAAGRAGAEEGVMTQGEAQQRADELSYALQSRGIDGATRARIGEELWQLHSAFTLRAFSTAGMSADEIATMKADRPHFMPHEQMTDRPRELTQEFFDGKHQGADRFRARDELAAELTGDGKGSSSASAATGARTAGIDPAALRAELKGLSPGARNARLDALFGSPAGTDSTSGEAAA